MKHLKKIIAVVLSVCMLIGCVGCSSTSSSDKKEGSKTTTINGVELKIYKYEDIYFTEFKFNDYYFDIETSKITEQELSDFLLSIMK